MARRLILILLIPLLGFGAFVARVYLDRQDERDRHTDAAAVLRLSTGLGELTYALDAETGAAVEDIDESVLDAARIDTNDKLGDARELLAASASLLPPEVAGEVDEALIAVERVVAERGAEEGSTVLEHSLAAVDDIDVALADLAATVITKDVTAELIAHRALLGARTSALVEQVYITAALSGDDWDIERYEAVIDAAEDEAMKLAVVTQLPISRPSQSAAAPSRLTEARARLAREGPQGLPDLPADEFRTLTAGWRAELREAADTEVEVALITVSDARAAAVDRMRTAVVLGSLVMLASVIAVLSGTVLHDRRVARLKRHMVEVAEGNLDMEPFADSRDDEIAIIADAFDHMTEAVRRAAAAEAAEADILERIARGGDPATVLPMIAGLATQQTGVEHRIVTDEPDTPSAEPIRVSEGDAPQAWLVRVGAEPLTGPRPAIVGTCIGLALLAFERDRTDQTLTYQATHDVLTGLANRAVLLRETERALRRGGPGRTAVLYCDLDGFKAINDAHGHRAGDRVLVEAATRLRTVIGTSGLLARVGGDEFVALLPEISAIQNATDIANRILGVIDGPFQSEQTSLSMSVSVGIALAGSGTNAEDLVRNADLALYRAKAGGRARWELFDAELGEWAAQRVETANALRTALDEDQIELWYQPVYGIAGGLVGFEGLVRWNRPGHGIVSPADFLAVAEETGMIVPLGERVLTEGCRQLAAWASSVPSVPTVLSLNMSGAQLTHSAFSSRLADTLGRTKAPANRLQVEITETVLLENRVEAASTLAVLRRMGVRVAIDDFGSGYSSLAYLRELPVDLLKVDRAFIDTIDDSAEDQAIVQAVLTLADALEMVVIAEGVERPEQLRELKRLGCRYVQGFLMGRPMTAFAATKLLEDELAASETTASPTG